MRSLQVGNDIVDLDFDRELNAERFARRVLSSSEFEHFCCGEDSYGFLWRAWSAKETAYKYIRQVDHLTQFLPAQFEYSLNYSSVSYLGHTVPVNHEVCDDYVYCWTSPSGSEHFQHQIQLLLSGGDEKVAVRNLALGLLVEITGYSSREISFGRSKCGAPVVFIAGQISPVALSFTHHGQYVACAIVYR